MKDLKELHPDDLVCFKCYQPCNLTMIDIGIGSYEYCGAVGFDSRMVEVSDCCGAAIWPAGKLLTVLDDVSELDS